MSRRSVHGTAALVVRHLRSRASTSLALALLVGVAVAVSALIPRGLVIMSDAEVQHELGSLPVGRSDLFGTGTFGPLDTTGAPTAEKLFGSTDAVLRAVPDGTPQPLRDSLGPVSWVALLQPDLVTVTTPRVPVQPVLRLALDLSWLDRVTFIQGTAPTTWAGNPDVPLEIAISQDYAEQTGYAVGDPIDFSDAPLIVSGIYSATDPDDPYWVHARELLRATVTNAPSSPTIVRGAAFIDPASAAWLPVQLQRAELRAWYPLIAETMTFDEVPELDDQVRRMTSLGLYLPTGEALVFETGLPAALERITTAVASVTAVLALAGSAPLGALIAVLALGTGAVLERRRTTLVLASSRGASERQLRVTMLIEGLLIGVPSVALALVAVGVLLPVPVEASSYVLPALIALAVPVLFVASSPHGGDARADLGTTRRRGRWIVELVVVGAATLAVLLLVQRGLVVTANGAVDPLLAATPLLLSLVVCVIVLRLYPLPLLALQRSARTGSSPVGLVGATSAVRANAAAFGSVLAMVVGVSAAVFSLVLSSTIATGLGTAAVGQAGSDIRVDAATLDDLGAVAGMDGVRAVAAFDTVPGVTIVFGLDTPHVTAVFADTAALHQVRPDIPVLREGSILVSDDIADRSQSQTQLNGHPVTVVGTLPSLALPDLDRSWVLVDVADEVAIMGEEPSYGTVLIATTPGTDTSALAGTIHDVVYDWQRPVDRDRLKVIDITTLVTEAAARPTIAVVTVALLAAAVLSLLLCTLAVALGALGASAARSRNLAVLRLLGMSPAQLRGVLAWELAPVTITAMVAGTGFGLGLALVVTALVDFRSVVGGPAHIDASVPWAVVAVTVVGFAVVVALTGALTSVAARTLTASAAVKMGAE